MLCRACRICAQLTGMSVAWRVLDLPGNSAKLTVPGGRCTIGCLIQQELEEGEGHLGWATVGSGNLHKKRVHVIAGGHQPGG